MKDRRDVLETKMMSADDQLDELNRQRQDLQEQMQSDAMRQVKALLAELTERFATIGQELLAISAETGHGLEVLKEWIARVMETVRAERRDDLPGD